jgi:hypothetical protein
MSLSGMRVVRCKVEAPLRGRAEGDISSTEDDVSALASWLEYERSFLLPEDLVSTAVQSSAIQSVAEVGQARGLAGLDGAVTVAATVDYDLFTKDTRAELRTEGAHFLAAPRINEAALVSMADAHSVEAFAKSIDMKLPRIVSVLSTQGGGPPGPTYNQFEELRWAVARDAGQSDYGMRLHNLARIVCHAYANAARGQAESRTPAMAALNCRDILTAETPLITATSLMQDCWVYTADEASPAYKAFLTMGVRGLQHYVTKETQTIYSRLVSDPEASGERITFVRKSGIASGAPAVADYVQALVSPDLVHGFYMAYAGSLGMRHQASQVLIQTMLGPHLWGERAVLPYRYSHPRLDAATYLLQAGGGAEHSHAIVGLNRLVETAPIIAARFKAAVGSLLGGFQGGGGVALADVVAQVVGVVSNAEQARAMLRNVWACVSGGYAALEWINPFTSDVSAAFDAFILSYRNHSQLLAQCRKTPSSAMAALFSSGVDMTHAIPGVNLTADGVSRFAETLIYQTLAGVPLKCRCEPDTAGMLGPNVALLGVARAWQAVVHWVKYTVKTPTVASAKAPVILETQPEAKPAPGFVHVIPQTRTEVTPSEGGTVVPIPRVMSPQRHVRTASSDLRQPSHEEVRRRSDSVSSRRSTRSTRTQSNDKVTLSGMAP